LGINGIGIEMGMGVRIPGPESHMCWNHTLIEFAHADRGIAKELCHLGSGLRHHRTAISASRKLKISDKRKLFPAYGKIQQFSVYRAKEPLTPYI